MSRPQHFSRDLQTRCLHLIRELGPVVAKGERAGPFGGPLTTTFLLAMAMPMLVLPFERIVQPATQRRAHGDDRDLDAGLTKRMLGGLGGPFKDMPFYEGGAWSLVDTTEAFNTAGELPAGLAAALSEQASFDRAANERAFDFLEALRHSLAHGGVMYLDRTGNTSRDEDPVAMMAFVSVAYPNDLKHLRVIRVDEGSLKNFLAAWAKWVAFGPVEELLDDVRQVRAEPSSAAT